MNKKSRRLVLAAIVVAALVAIASVADMATGYPFARYMTMDAMFLVSAALVIYMGIEVYRELS